MFLRIGAHRLFWFDEKKSQSCLILHTKYSKYPDSFVLHPIFSRKKTLASSVSFHKYHLYWCRAPLSHAACAFLPHKDVFWLNIVPRQFSTQVAKMQKTFETYIHLFMHRIHLTWFLKNRVWNFFQKSSWTKLIISLIWTWFLLPV